MASVPQLNRQFLRPNNRRAITQEFKFNSNQGVKSIEEPSIVTWASPGRGVAGESVNSQDNASKQVIRKSWRAP